MPPPTAAQYIQLNRDHLPHDIADFAAMVRAQHHGDTDTAGHHADAIETRIRERRRAYEAATAAQNNPTPQQESSR